MTIIRKGAALAEGGRPDPARHRAMILGTALHWLEPAGTGAAPTTPCIGGAMGAATIIGRP
jgi:hypothetical protein